MALGALLYLDAYGQSPQSNGPGMDPNAVGDTLVAYFGAVSDHWLAYLMALATLSTLTMALLEAIKSLTPVRRYFHGRVVKKWLERQATCVREEPQAPIIAAEAENTIIQMGADGERKAFFEMDGDALFQQLTQVLQLAVDYPLNYPKVVTVVASRAAAHDMQVVLGKTSANEIERSDAQRRVRQQVLQGLAALQVQTAQTWKNGMRCASFAVSFSIAYLALWWGKGEKSLIEFALVALLSALLAPVARDLVIAVEKLRQ